jgi:hypothetical protein
MKSLPVVSPKQTRVGWIGTGVMGTSMCGHMSDTLFSYFILLFHFPFDFLVK